MRLAIANILVAALLAALPAIAEEPLLFAIHRKADPLTHAPHAPRTLHNGLWRWAGSGEPQRLLHGDPSWQPFDTPLRPVTLESLRRTLVTYPNSSLAISNDGRWAAVSGLVYDDSPDVVELHGKMRQKKKLLPQVYGNDYRVLLIDMQSDLAQPTVYPVFDTLACKATVKRGGDYFLSASEYPVPLEANRLGFVSEDGRAPQQCDFGMDAKIVLRFSADAKLLHLRILRAPQPADAKWSGYGPSYWPTGRSLPVNQTAAQSFVLDIEYPDYAQPRPYPMPNEPYRTLDSLRSDESGSMEVFSFAQQSPLQATSVLTRRLIKEKSWWLGAATYEYVHTLFLRALDPSCESDNASAALGEIAQQQSRENLVCSRLLAKQEWVSSVNFLPELRWFNGDESLMVRRSAGDYEVYSVRALLRAAAEAPLMDSKPLAIAPYLRTKVRGMQMQQLPFDGDRYDRLAVSDIREPFLRGDLLAFVQPASVNAPRDLAFSPVPSWYQEYIGLPLLMAPSQAQVRYLLLPEYWSRVSGGYTSYEKILQQSVLGNGAAYTFDPDSIAKVLDANIHKPYIDVHSRHVYFHEQRRRDIRSADEVNLRQAYRRVVWPTMSRMPIGGNDASASEFLIERFAMREVAMDDWSGYTRLEYGWLRGLAGADAQAGGAPVWPIAGVVDYLVQESAPQSVEMDELLAAVYNR